MTYENLKKRLTEQTETLESAGLEEDFKTWPRWMKITTGIVGGIVFLAFCIATILVG